MEYLTRFTKQSAESKFSDEFNNVLVGYVVFQKDDIEELPHKDSDKPSDYKITTKGIDKLKRIFPGEDISKCFWKFISLREWEAECIGIAEFIKRNQDILKIKI